MSDEGKTHIRKAIGPDCLSIDSLSRADSLASLTDGFSLPSIGQLLSAIKDKGIRKIVADMMKNAYKIMQLVRTQAERSLTDMEFNEYISANNDYIEDCERLNEGNNCGILAGYTVSLDPGICDWSNICSEKDRKIESLKKEVKDLTVKMTALQAQLDMYEGQMLKRCQAETDLAPFFVNHPEKEVRIHDFVGHVTGAKPKAITAHINAMIKDGYMDGNMVKKELYDVLAHHKLYNLTYSTFSAQVDAKRD